MSSAGMLRRVVVGDGGFETRRCAALLNHLSGGAGVRSAGHLSGSPQRRAARPSSMSSVMSSG